MKEDPLTENETYVMQAMVQMHAWRAGAATNVALISLQRRGYVERLQAGLKLTTAGSIALKVDISNKLSELAQLREEVVKLRKILANCQWYWPVDDTSSESCAESPREASERVDLQPGHVFQWARGGVVETGWYGYLPPAEDSESDDDFEVHFATEAEALARLQAEIERRGKSDD